MATIPNKVRDRLVAGVKKFQPILAAAKARDVNEADTVTIIKDLLADVFGYEKYSEVTSEYAIRGTFVDLAIKVDGALQLLIEVKAIGIDLKDTHTKQAVDYAANQGVEWVALTNGDNWHIYRVSFGQPIGQELVFEFDFLGLNAKSTDDEIETLYLLTKEGFGKSVLSEYHEQKQALSRYFIGAMLLTDPVLDVIRRELRRISPDVKIDAEQISKVLTREVLKREVIEGDKADEARRRIIKVANRALRKTKDAVTSDSEPTVGLAPADADPVQEKTEFDVILKDSGAKKIEVFKVVRQLVPKLSQKEAADIIDGTPQTVLSAVSKEAAVDAKAKLEASGAGVEVKPHSPAA